MTMNPAVTKSPVVNRLAYTLVELLVVISIISVLAAFTLAVLKPLKRQQYIKTARAEMDQIATALENYKAQYGGYPQFSGGNPLLNPLYYELSGTTLDALNAKYVTLDGSSSIPTNSVLAAYGVASFVNRGSKYGSEDAAAARNFLPALKPNRIYYPVTNNGVPTTMLVTSVNGPDQYYQPLNAPGLNPFRYVCPGVQNPNSYDLWVQLVVSGTTNLICNWNRQVQINSPLP